MVKGEIAAKQPLVVLSVSGTCFTVPREVLIENEWTLSKIGVEDTSSWAQYADGRFVLQQDPIAFRSLLYYGQTQSLPPFALSSIHHLRPIRKLAKFLCFQSLIDYIDDSTDTLRADSWYGHASAKEPSANNAYIGFLVNHAKSGRDD